jgi:hypothetical protein
MQRQGSYRRSGSSGLFPRGTGRSVSSGRMRRRSARRPDVVFGDRFGAGRPIMSGVAEPCGAPHRDPSDRRGAEQRPHDLPTSGLDSHQKPDLCDDRHGNAVASVKDRIGHARRQLARRLALRLRPNSSSHVLQPAIDDRPKYPLSNGQARSRSRSSRPSKTRSG